MEALAKSEIYASRDCGGFPAELQMPAIIHMRHEPTRDSARKSRRLPAGFRFLAALALAIGFLGPALGAQRSPAPKGGRSIACRTRRLLQRAQVFAPAT
jgi:hypothetical protein